MNPFKPLLILTVFAALLSLGTNRAIANISNLSDRVQGDRPSSAQAAAQTERNLSNSKGTLKEGSVLSIDPDEVTGIPKAEARRRFILNKIYRVEEGTTADDLFIVDEKANKWAVEDVSEATMGATTRSVALMVSGNGKVWALIQKF